MKPYVRVKKVKDKSGAVQEYYYLEGKVFVNGKWTTQHLRPATPQDVLEYGIQYYKNYMILEHAGKICPGLIKIRDPVLDGNAGKIAPGQTEKKRAAGMPEINVLDNCRKNVPGTCRKTLELFSGSKSFSKVAKSYGLDTFTIDNNRKLQPDICIDIMDLEAGMIKENYSDNIFFLWASPPCQCFSVASHYVHWKKEGNNYVPQDEETLQSIEVVKHTIALIKELKPEYWIIENPRGMLNKMPFMQGFRKSRVHYCQYGDKFQKPTDLWNNILSWNPRQVCSRGSPCHEPAPRGSNSGIQNSFISTSKRATVPQELCEEILLSAMSRTKQLTFPGCAGHVPEKKISIT